MKTLILNNEEFEITSFNKYTSIQRESIRSNASINMADNSDYNRLYAMGEDTITSLVIKNGETTIYSLSNIGAKIDSMNEIMEDDIIRLVVNIDFNPANTQTEYI